MIVSRSLALMTLVLAAVPAPAQAPKVSGLVQIWYTQMLDNNLRLNSAASSYYNLRGEFKENGFNVRRTELKFAGKIQDGLDYEVMIDPSINTSTSNPTILQDAVIHYKHDDLELKLGQFKTLQTYEGNISSGELLFVERSMAARTLGDKRDRGLVAAYGFGDPKGFAGKLAVGVFNGMVDAVAGKAGDANAQKDFVARLEFSIDTRQKFGVYTLQGGTDQSDKGGTPTTALAAKPWAVNSPSAADILANKDKTTNLGAFYVYQDATWHCSGEVITGLLGRRFPTVAVGGGTASREHLDQKFLGLTLTAGFTTGHHAFRLRYDAMNYNQGNDWYTPGNPYTSAGAEYSPKYTETTAGYTYAFLPETLKAANLKLNYIVRSSNFLKPRPGSGQTSEQGGNTLVAAFQIAF